MTTLIKNRWNLLLIVLASVMIILETSNNIYRLFFESRHYDFYQSYLAARSLISGTNLYQSGQGAYIYPPFFAFILTPLGQLSEKFAHLIWLGLNVAFIPIILILGFRILASAFQLSFSRWQAAGACALAVLLSLDQIHGEFIQNQNDLLILCGIALSLYWLDRKPFTAGTCLGLVAAIKYQGLFFLPFLIFRARWRVAMGLIIGLAGGAFLPALMIGWNRNLEYLQIALRGMANMTGLTHLPLDYAARVPLVTWGANVSISSGMMRIFQDRGWPESNAYLLLMGLAISTFVLLWWMFQRQGIAFIWRTPQTFGNPQQEKMIVNLEWCALLIFMLVFSPQGTKRHLILLLNVNLLAAVMLLFPRPPIKRWPLLAGTIMVVLAIWRLPLPSAFFNFWTYVGFPYWSYLFFLPILVNSGLAYYQDIYANEKYPLSSEAVKCLC